MTPLEIHAGESHCGCDANTARCPTGVVILHLMLDRDERDWLREEIRGWYSYLANHYQDADLDWLAKQMRSAFTTVIK